MEAKQKKILLAVTGASGSIYSYWASNIILSSGNVYYFSYTIPGKKVMDLELSQSQLTFIQQNALNVFKEQDIDAPIASGSFPIDGMLIAPCSLHTAMSIGCGLASNVIERAAQVMLKEKRPLVLLLRETPLAVNHLESLAKLASAGAVVMPASPFFYHSPNSINDLIIGLVARALRLLNLEVNVYEWHGGNKDGNKKSNDYNAKP